MAEETITLKLVAQDLASGNISKAIGKIDTLAKRGGIAGSVFQGIGLSMGMVLNPLALGAKAFHAIEGFIGGAVDAASAFEDQMAKVNTIARLSDKALDRLGDQVQALAVERGRPVDDLTQGLYDLVSAGVKAEKAMGVLKDATTLSIGSLSTTAEAVDLLTSTLNAYQLEAEDSTRITDIWAKSVEVGKVTAADLASAVSQVIPVAASMGIEIEEVAAAMAFLSARGSQAGEVAQYMRQAMAALLKPSKELADLEEDLGLSFAEIARNEGVVVALQRLREAVGGNLSAMGRMLGRVQGLSFALTTTGENYEDFRKTLGEMGRPGAAMAQMAERTDTLAYQQGRFNAAIETFNQEVGKDLVGLLADAAAGASDLWAELNRPPSESQDRFRAWADSFRDVAEAQKELGVTNEALKYDLGSLEDIAADTPLGALEPHIGEAVKLWREYRKEFQRVGITYNEWSGVFFELKDDLGLGADAAVRLTREWAANEQQMQRTSMQAAWLAANYERVAREEGGAAKGAKGLRAQLEPLTEDELKALTGALEDAADGLVGPKGLAEGFKAARRQADKLTGGKDTLGAQYRKAGKEVEYWERQMRRAVRTNDKDLYALAQVQHAAATRRWSDLDLVIRALRIEHREMMRNKRAAVETAAEAVNAEKGRRAAINLIITKLGVSRDRAQELYDLWSKEWPDPKLDVDTSSIDAALTKIQTFRNKAGQTVTVPVEFGAPRQPPRPGGWDGDPSTPWPMAKGGIVTAPTLALLGEQHRPEAVIPLDRAQGFGDSYTFHIGFVPDARAFAEQVGPEMERWRRRAGV